MKYLLTLALLLPSFSQAAITGWKKYQIPYNYIISNDLVKRHCGSTKAAISQIKEKNNLSTLDKIRIGDSILLPVCNNNEELYISSSEEYPLVEKARPKDNSSNIVNWEQVTVQKGYMLSKDLVYQKIVTLLGRNNLKNLKLKTLR